MAGINPAVTAREQENDSANGTAFPRRSCRQPVASRRAERSAREIRPQARSPAEALRAVEDREIEKAIKKQEEIGLKLATDGEFRRSWWHFDFFARAATASNFIRSAKASISRRQNQSRERAGRRQGRLSPPIRISTHFRFVKAHSRVMPKMTIPAPSACCISARAAARSAAMPIRISSPISTTSPRPTARRSALSTMPAAAICNSTTPPGR